MKTLYALLGIVALAFALIVWAFPSPAYAGPATVRLSTVKAMDGFFWLKAQFTYPSDAHGPADSTEVAYVVTAGYVSAGQHWIVGQPARDSFLVPDGGSVVPIAGTISVHTMRDGLTSPYTTAPFSYAPPVPPPAPAITGVQTVQQ